MRARLVLEPTVAELTEVACSDKVLIAEVASITIQGTRAEVPLDVTYMESIPHHGAERRLERWPVGWPLVVYVRRDGGAETREPERGS